MRWAGRQSQSNEILKLRGEVARLRVNLRESTRLKDAGGSGTNDPGFEVAFQELAARATQIRQRLEQKPELTIPELKFLSSKDWLEIASYSEKLQSDEDFGRYF